VVTRDDVARRAGTSAAVVSYVLNDGPRPVAAATRQRVLDAVKELGYRPNAIARALSERRSRALGLVVSDISNPFIGELAGSIEREAFERGYTVLLGNTMVDEERERRYLRHFIDRQADGLLIVPVGMDQSMIDELNTGTIPVVVLDRPVPGLTATSFLADNEVGAALATTHLLDHGHVSIACLGGPEQLAPTTARIAGWARTVRGAGLAPSLCPLARGTVRRRAGYEVALELLGRSPRPTAIFATTDEQGIGVLRAAADLGLRIPDDLAVVSFDGIAQGAFCVPRLTTVRQPIASMGHAAVDAVLAQVGAPRPRPTLTTFPVELVKRGSCGCPDRDPD